MASISSGKCKLEQQKTKKPFSFGWVAFLLNGRVILSSHAWQAQARGAKGEAGVAAGEYLGGAAAGFLQHGPGRDNKARMFEAAAEVLFMELDAAHLLNQILQGAQGELRWREIENDRSIDDFGPQTTYRSCQYPAMIRCQGFTAKGGGVSVSPRSRPASCTKPAS